MSISIDMLIGKCYTSPVPLNMREKAEEGIKVDWQAF